MEGVGLTAASGDRAADTSSREAQSRLARGLAHELANLGQVMANAEHVISNPATPVDIVAEACDILRQAARRCASLVTTLRALQQVGAAAANSQRLTLEAAALQAFRQPAFDVSALLGTETLVVADPQILAAGLIGLATCLAVCVGGLAGRPPGIRVDVELATHRAALSIGPLDHLAAMDLRESIERPFQGSQLDQHNHGETYLAEQRLAAAGCELRVDETFLRVLAPLAAPL